MQDLFVYLNEFIQNMFWKLLFCDLHAKGECQSKNQIYVLEDSFLSFYHIPVENISCLARVKYFVVI